MVEKNFSFATSLHEDSRKLSDQILRLQDYINQLRKEAKYLGNGLSGDQADKLQKIVDSSDLEAITEALLTIDKQTVLVTGDAPDDLSEGEVSASQTIYVPKGYYDKDTTLTVQSLSDSSAVAEGKKPNEDDVVAGKEFWADGVKYTGNLVDNSGATVETTSDNTATAKENETVKVHIPKAKYDEDSVIETNIPVHTTYAYDAEVEVSKDEEGADHATLKTITIKAGYYDKDVIVTPKFSDVGTYESVVNVKELNITESGEFDPHNDKSDGKNGYDYYSKVNVNEAQISNNAALDIPTATVTVSVTQAGYTDESSYSVVIPSKDAPTAVDSEFAKDSAANVTVTPKVSDAQSITIPAGLYKQDTVIKINSMADGATLSEADIELSGNPVYDEASDKFVVTVSVNKSGYIAADDYEASSLDKSEIAFENVAGDTITAKTISVSTEEGYTAGEQFELTVQDTTFDSSAISVPSKGKITVTPAQKGWFEGNTFDLASTDSVNTFVDQLATTSEAKFVYSDVADLVNGKNTEKYAGGEGIYYKEATTDLTDLVTALADL